jgi:hypothetical protein
MFYQLLGLEGVKRENLVYVERVEVAAPPALDALLLTTCLVGIGVVFADSRFHLVGTEFNLTYWGRIEDYQPYRKSSAEALDCLTLNVFQTQRQLKSKAARINMEGMKHAVATRWPQTIDHDHRALTLKNSSDCLLGGAFSPEHFGRLPRA